MYKMYIQMNVKFRKKIAYKVSDFSYVLTQRQKQDKRTTFYFWKLCTDPRM